MTSTTQLHSVQDSHARFEAGDDIADHGYPATSDAAGGDNGNGPTRNVRAPKKARATKPIPTDRLSFENQLAVLKNVAITSGNTRRGSNSNAMSAAIGLKGDTGGLIARFFRSAGWFELADARGEYTASPGTIAWNQHITVDSTAQYDAAAKMRAEVAKSWFWEVLEPMLASGHSIRDSLALLELAKAAGATNHVPQLTMILQWLEWVGLIVIEDDYLRLRADRDAPAEPGEDSAESVVVSDGESNSDADDVAEEMTPPQLTTADESRGRPAGVVDTEAIVSFTLSVRLTADDLQVMDETQRDFVLALAERLRG
ncbi:hypothetical protein [Nocardioides antri]|uniref:Uncharacterized protein n=1 Tax=Nocardioides antri TaxID=2607659 RepID=A0A5B1M4J6_9ACTN|nr:hypothetical protein [Nocardioides antri]KAA1427862.1 hypothetical protein F0U47_10605 [Nocardioides antri]